MKFLHFADFHLGMENYGKLAPSGLHQRVEEFLMVLDEIVDTVIEKKIDCVFFSGDAFKNREPSQTLIVAFADRIARMRESGAQVFLLVGNHDMPVSQARANTLDIYAALSLDGVYVASQPCVYKPVLKDGTVLELIMIPWLHKQHIHAADLSMDELAAELGKKVKSDFYELLASLDSQKASAYGLQKQRPLRVVLLHGTVSGAVFGAERSVMLGSDVVISKGMFENKGIDYVALGHLHQFQVLAEQPPIIYSGSPVRIDFSEEQDKKGYIVGDITSESCQWEFVESQNAASFLTIRLDAADVLDQSGELQGSLFDGYQIADAIVRVVLSGSATDLQGIDDSQLLLQLQNARYVVAIGREVIDPQHKARLDLGNDAHLLDESSVIDSYMTYKGFDSDEQEKIRKKIQQFQEDM